MATYLLLPQNKIEAANTDFVVTPEAPQSQLPNSEGIFNLYLQPGQTEDLNLRVENKADKARTMFAQLNTGYTNDNGTSVFDSAKIPKEPTLKYNLKNQLAIGKTNLRVKMKAHQSGYISFKIKAPDQPFNGEIYGGVTATIYNANTNVTDNGTLLRNNYQYAIPIYLTNVQNISGVQPDIKLGTIKPGINSGDPAVLVQTRNVKPKYLRTMDVKAKITKKGESKVLHRQNQKNVSMAPNSTFNYAIGWGKNRIEPGQYHLSWTGQSQGVKTWHFERDFTISNDQASRINNLAGFKPNYLWLWILLAVLLVILLLVLGIWLGRRNSKSKNAGNRRRQR
ncbi:DUF916 and DUF3324 domain-containing protein [Agrilactobacillus fermenti]|uniref:DUF916 and DUF3324 domain-containing protein n=1 Tax=Agrilactobacillus fermenti TaxID=2586909 RepID=UPI001E37DF7F|nr:DUF916 and DUF3324 domain-containing protein [Agrilactobacillus fermenti]MCD2256953.1 DUF916 and DUF3324 domain-containing protein [Agrilactobacillus fermenti]